MKRRLKHEFEGSDFKKSIRFLISENGKNFQVVQSNPKNYAVYREGSFKRIFLDVVGSWEEAKSLIQKASLTEEH